MSTSGWIQPCGKSNLSRVNTVFFSPPLHPTPAWLTAVSARLSSVSFCQHEATRDTLMLQTWQKPHMHTHAQLNIAGLCYSWALSNTHRLHWFFFFIPDLFLSLSQTFSTSSSRNILVLMYFYFQIIKNFLSRYNIWCHVLSGLKLCYTLWPLTNITSALKVIEMRRKGEHSHLRVIFLQSFFFCRTSGWQHSAMV